MFLLVNLVSSRLRLVKGSISNTWKSVMYSFYNLSARIIKKNVCTCPIFIFSWIEVSNLIDWTYLIDLKSYVEHDKPYLVWKSFFWDLYITKYLWIHFLMFKKYSMHFILSITYWMFDDEDERYWDTLYIHNEIYKAGESCIVIGKLGMHKIIS